MSRPPITFITGQYVPQCRHDIDKHFSDYQTIQYMDGGQVSLCIDQQVYALNGRWFWSAWPGPRIAFKPAVPGGCWVHRYLAFRGELVTRWRHDGLFPILPQPSPGGGSAGKRMDEVIRLSRNPDKWDQVRAGHALEAILIELAAARASVAPAGWVASVADELAGKAVEDAVDYESLSQRQGVSLRTLRRNFRNRLGTSPHQYRIEKRVQQAREMLLETDTPIKEIARSLGYSDVFYFGRQFKRHTGVSPAVFRRSREG